MAITNYSTLKTAIADWLDRDDLTSQIDTFIDLCEAQIYRRLRIRAMETALSDTIASGVISVPSTYLELINAYIDGSSAEPLQLTTPNHIYQRYPTRSSQSKPLYIAREGSSFIFGPYPDSTYTIKGLYYASLTALSTSNETNWFTSNAPDLLLFGSLVAATPYIGDDERAVLWKAQYEEAIAEVTRQDRKERWADRAPIRVMPQ